MRVVRVPKNCAGVLLKDGRAVLKEVEARGGVKINLGDDSAKIEGEPEREWLAEKVLDALSYGFRPKKALKLFSDDFFLEKIDLAAALRGKSLDRYKARIIGTRGKAKRNLEEMTGASISVGEECVAFIGRFDEIRAAREAVLRILEGAEHSTVYSFLERMAREKNREEPP